MANRQQQRRCLIVERHDWETGGRQQQLQFPLNIARDFFGAGRRRIHIRVFLTPSSANPTYEKDVTISATYAGSQTRRVNGFSEIGSLDPCFLFFEETNGPDTYDVWWQADKAIVAAHFDDWAQGQNSQYGRGRLSIIVPAPVLRRIDRV
jgi:hypothetical protein